MDVYAGRTHAAPLGALERAPAKIECVLELRHVPAIHQHRAGGRLDRFNVLHLEPLKRALEIEGHPLGLDRGLERAGVFGGNPKRNLSATSDRPACAWPTVVSRCSRSSSVIFFGL